MSYKICHILFKNLFKCKTKGIHGRIEICDEIQILKILTYNTMIFSLKPNPNYLKTLKTKEKIPSNLSHIVHSYYNFYIPRKTIEFRTIQLKERKKYECRRTSRMCTQRYESTDPRTSYRGRKNVLHPPSRARNKWLLLGTRERLFTSFLHAATIVFQRMQRLKRTSSLKSTPSYEIDVAEVEQPFTWI